MECSSALFRNNIRIIEMAARVVLRLARHNCVQKPLSLFLTIEGFFNREAIASVRRNANFPRYLALIWNNCRPNRLSGNSAWILRSFAVRVFGLLQVRLRRQRRQICLRR